MHIPVINPTTGRICIPNYDEEARIYYGCISQHQLDGDALAEILYSENATDLTYDAAVEEIKEKVFSFVEHARKTKYEQGIEYRLKKLLEELDVNKEGEHDEIVDRTVHAWSADDLWDAFWDEIQDDWNDHWDAHGDSYLYDDSVYIIQTCLDSDLLIIKSPFVTFAPKCSPCVPNAGNLSDTWGRDFDLQNWENNSGQFCYCLSEDWFAEERPCPYPYWRPDGELVYRRPPA